MKVFLHFNLPLRCLVSEWWGQNKQKRFGLVSRSKSG